jgi:peptidoglycan/xylan/chitin deacetylase (PgdA/CDA1 family)
MYNRSADYKMKRKKRDCPLPTFISGVVLLMASHSGYGFAAVQDSDGAPARRAVAITVDDVPYVGGPQHIEDVRRVTERFLQVVRERAVPVSAFVTGANVLVEGQVDDRMALLERWCDAGIDLEGHSNSHLSFNDLGLQNYIDDVVQGLLLPKRIMEARGRAVRFYRHPFNHTGANEQAKRAFEDFSRARKIQLAPFTVEHADYLFNSIYLDARARADLTQLDVAFNFAERISRENFGREIPQISTTMRSCANEWRALALS